MKLRVREARTMGQDHRLMFKNCHDAKSSRQFEANGVNYTIGVVCDGCGEGLHSEVGAKLLADFIPRKIQRLILHGCSIDNELLFRFLYDSIVEFFNDLVLKNNFIDEQESVAYIKNHLLATVVGFVCDSEKIVTFNSGDGLIVYNDELYILDQNNKPMYVAYHLIDRKYLINQNATVLSNDFEIRTFTIDENFERLIISTDGTVGVNGEELDLIPFYRGMKKEISLQKKFNVWSDIDKRFKDDATAILLEKDDSNE